MDRQLVVEAWLLKKGAIFVQEDIVVYPANACGLHNPQIGLVHSGFAFLIVVRFSWKRRTPLGSPMRTHIEGG